MENAIYNTIGQGYNRTRKADPYLLSRMAHYLAAKPDKHYLDIGCGTGNYTIGLHAHGIQFTGVDPSERMLTEARAKCSTIQWLRGQAEAIPLPDDSMDGALGSLTLHHWSSLQQGFAELARVLKPGSRFTVFTTTPEQTGAYWLAHYFPSMLANSCKVLPAFSAVESALAASNFKIVHSEKYFVKPDLEDLFLYSGKYNPELYFDPQVRAGISSFSAFANAEEVAHGLELLRQHIDNGRVEAVMAEYENDKGDYLFIQAELSA